MDEAPLCGPEVRSAAEYPKVKIPQYLAAHGQGIAGISSQLSCRVSLGGNHQHISHLRLGLGRSRGRPLA